MGISDEELARRAGTSRQRASEWRNGHHAPAPATLLAIARALQVQPWELTTARPDTAELYDLRVWAGQDQRTLAAHAGIPFGTYARMEAGHFTGPPGRLERIAAHLGVGVDAVLAAQARTRDRYRRAARRGD